MRLTHYWIIVASKEHVLKGIAGGFAQACHGKKSPLSKIKTGDYVIYYSGKTFFNQKEKCQAFTAIGKVRDDTIYQVEMSTLFHPFRMSIDYFQAQEVSILPLIDKLSFIPNKKKWGYPFRWGILSINEQDFQRIARQMLYDRENHF